MIVGACCCNCTRQWQSHKACPVLAIQTCTSHSNTSFRFGCVHSAAATEMQFGLCYGVVVNVQVMQSSLSGNKATNGAGISVQQVAFMSLYNVSITVRLMHYSSRPIDQHAAVCSLPHSAQMTVTTSLCTFSCTSMNSISLPDAVHASQQMQPVCLGTCCTAHEACCRLICLCTAAWTSASCISCSQFCSTVKQQSCFAKQSHFAGQLSRI